MKKSNFYENKQHGSSKFPFEYYFIDKSSPRFYMPAHWHKEFEIIRIVKGNFELHLNNARYELSASDIITVDCGCIHHGIPTDDCVYECIVFNLNMLTKQQSDSVHALISPLTSAEATAISMIKKGESDAYEPITDLFETAKSGGKFYELDIYSLLFKVFSIFFKEDRILEQPNKKLCKQSRAISAVLDKIEADFDEDITLTELAQIAELNEKYLCRIFKEYTEKTIIEYINEVRVENACYEISIARKNITRAAFDSGFNDLSYFSKTFKKLKGISPTEYKKKFEG
ncbi:MAG: helix-turn-helix transcriptional regulator [Clostridia bacterium]|nr:helix-turn-helix transcriptional regulator [Clostridia bacterium]